MSFKAPDNSFVFDKNVQKILRILHNKAKIVGGAVRNQILNIPVQDIDIATEFMPENVIEICNNANIRTIPTGISHGTVTAIIDGKKFEITTLRKDIIGYGRAAKVEFGTDWEADAQRRDFTINALYLNSDGSLYDPLNGFNDVINSRLKFIGDPQMRISEDYLRILRYFRFCGQFNSNIDPKIIRIITGNIQNLRALSAERIEYEIKKFFIAPYSHLILPVMAEIGVFQVLGLGVCYAIEDHATSELSYLEKLFYHFVWIDEDAIRICACLKLSTRQRNLMLLWSQFVWRIRIAPTVNDARKLLYYTNKENYIIILKIASKRWGWHLFSELNDVPTTHAIPQKPFNAQQFIEQGLTGKALGEALRAAENKWIAQDFSCGIA